MGCEAELQLSPLNSLRSSLQPPGTTLVYNNARHMLTTQPHYPKLSFFFFRFSFFQA